MIKMKGGFTLIEVSLFLAITGLLFLGVTIGVQNSIFQQRYNDSVQSFVEFLRNAYAKTENVQNAGSGDSNQAIYGKLITFGEECSLTSSPSSCVKNTDNEVYMYSVVGAARCGSGFGTLSVLSGCNANVIKDGGGAYLAESYRPKWSSVIQDINWNLFKGAIMIVRHPQSGTVYTFSMTGKTVEVNKGIGLKNFLNDNDSPFSNDRPVDFCINPNGNTDSGIMRADVRIVGGARNATGIEVVSDNDNSCVERG